MNTHQELSIAESPVSKALAWAMLLALSTISVARADVAFSGMEDSRLEANVRALSPLTTTSCDSARWRVERLFRDADQAIADAARALGYYEPTINKSLRWDDDCWPRRV